MQATAAACVERGVVIGAHVSYRDRQGFGRRVLPVEPPRLIDDVVEQGRALAVEIANVGGAVSFVKPHGALYHQMGLDPTVAEAVLEAMARLGIAVLVAQPHSVVVGRARERGIRLMAEGFPDRGYLADGRLAPRDLPGGMVDDPGRAGRRAVSMMRRGGVDAVDGSWVPIEAATLCIHGDAPDADTTARAVRSALEADGVTVGPFLGPQDPGRLGRGRLDPPGDR